MNTHNKIHFISDDDSISSNENIISPSIIIQQQHSMPIINNSDTDSDDYDENNIIVVGRRRKSFIKNSLNKFSNRIDALPKPMKNSLHVNNTDNENNIISCTKYKVLWGSSFIAGLIFILSI